MNCYQDEFDQTNGLRYLNHAAVAPWPRRAADAVSAFARENVAHGSSDYPEWLKIEHRLRERLARLLNARAGSDLALVKNTSEALSFVAFGLDWREGDQVVIGNEEFPSNRVVWEALRPRGVEVVEVGLAGDDPEGALLAACGPRTRLLSISAVQYASGLRLDLERIGTGCRRRGVLFCIDAIQQLGALPFDVQAYDCAFAMADGHKWMLGPEGLGVFYCHAEQRERLALHEYGWHMLEHALDYERRDWRPARSARRFECGSPNMLGAMALEASLGLLEEVGMERVDRDIAERVQWLQDGLSGIPGVRLHSPRNPSRRAGILTFSLDGQDSRTLFETLRQERVICAQRGGGIRFSPHFYTSSTVIDDTLAILRQVAGT
ncbi:aminotransferase class V-fold PLP-dependent enzyme [Pseudomonas aeruginosa]|uniref:aminotransferase class V-fold PLP-dependent enzyme n=1 Tax=Pseudomonas aeruginosa TaxID=287 RepID=UPI0022F0A78C|nr:aminotransferase class V-fold PLP-dependent enzyme [Pseudomonas aeruginosa]MDA5101762.1 aminotransferase class V-fold PLP-dependent enzyme [Pseudomonas aeruginosa]